MMQLFNMRQQDQEHLNDYVKRFKQSHDVLRSHMGSKWLDGFVEHTEEYKNETQAKEQSKLKEQAFEKFMALCY